MKYNKISIVIILIISIKSIQVKATCDEASRINFSLNGIQTIILDTNENSYPFGLDILAINNSEFIFITDTMLNTLTKYSLDGEIINKIDQIIILDITHSNDNKLFAFNRSNVLVFDTDLNRLSLTKSGFSMINGIYYDSDSERLYIADSESKIVTILNDTLDEMDSFEWTEEGGVFVLSVFSDIVYLGGNFSEIRIYKNKTLINKTDACIGDYIFGLHVDSFCEANLLVTCFNAKTIELYKIDGTSLTLVSIKQLNVSPNKITVDSNRSRIIYTHTGITKGFTSLEFSLLPAGK